MCVHVCSQYSRICLLYSKQTHLCLGGGISSDGSESREGRGCLFVPGVEDRVRRQLCACYGPRADRQWESFPAALLLLTIAAAWAEGSRAQALRPRERAVRPRERLGSEDLPARPPFAKSIRAGDTSPSFLVSCVQYSLN